MCERERIQAVTIAAKLLSGYCHGSQDEIQLSKQAAFSALVKLQALCETGQDSDVVAFLVDRAELDMEYG